MTIFETTILEKIKNIVQAALIGTKIEVVDIVFRRQGSKHLLKIAIDKEHGVSLDDCARINRDISEELDKANIIEEEFLLEVSSCGIDKQLTTDSDFLKVRGEKIKIVTKQIVHGSNVFTAILSDVKAKAIVIINDKGISLEIDRDIILRANRYLE